MFNAEEMGLLGSQYFVQSWAQFSSKYGEIEAMLNFDMIGRYKQEISVMGTGSSPDWSSLLKGIGRCLLKIESLNKKAS